jgi:nucleoside-diphosphate-sugar epimerase
MISKSSKTLAPVFVIGSGDIGCRIARLWQQQGAQVHTLGRSPAPCGGSTEHICADLDRPETLTQLPTANAILYFTAPPPAHGDDDPRMKNFLAAIDPAALPQRIVYISTSGVYGDCQGGWVDEEHAVKPQTPRAQRRLAAEQVLTQWAAQHQVATVILRVGGIYGPGRLPLERLRQGMVILQRDLAPYSNRIHADDLARVCVAAAHAPHQHALYNVSDGHPTTMSDYFIRVAAAAGLPTPIEVDWQTAEQTLSAEMLSYLHEAKRLDNARMLRELNVTLEYPTLTEGLKGCGIEACR